MMSGEELTVLISAFAISTAPYFSTDELNILVAVLTQLADTYATISILRDNNSDTQNDDATSADAVVAQS